MIKKTLQILLLCCLLTACKNSGSSQNQNVKEYVDLLAFFDAEVLRLKTLNPSVSKIVSVNEEQESKVLKIKDWEKELAIFKDADINKIAWKGLFRVSEAEDRTIYQSDDKKIQVKKLEIIKKGDKIKSVHAIIYRTNLLFSSKDTLDYYPDSSYKVIRSQKIKLLSEKKYTITGKFN